MSYVAVCVIIMNAMHYCVFVTYNNNKIIINVLVGYWD